MSSSVLQVRVDDNIKIGAGKVFRAMGITPSEGVRIFLSQVYNDGALPFRPTATDWAAHNASQHIPNNETIAAIEEGRVCKGKTFRKLDDLMSDLES